MSPGQGDGQEADPFSGQAGEMGTRQGVAPASSGAGEGQSQLT